MKNPRAAPCKKQAPEQPQPAGIIIHELTPKAPDKAVRKLAERIALAASKSWWHRDDE